MLKIRLQRVGRTKQPTYRIIVSENRKDTHAKALESLGIYNPLANPKIFEFKEERIKYWMSVGAKMSNTMNNLFVNSGLLKGAKKRSVTISNKRKAKLEAKKPKTEPAATATVQ
jgi:small subunit ribosomal protein S16